MRTEEKNLGFIQIYRETFGFLDDLISESPMANRLLYFFILNMSPNNNAFGVSINTLMEIFQKSKPTIINSLKVLEKHRYIQIIKQGSSNIYVVNEKVAWCKSRDEHQYAIFSATILASGSENKKAVEEFNKGINRKLRNVPKMNKVNKHETETK